MKVTLRRIDELGKRSWRFHKALNYLFTGGEYTPESLIDLQSLTEEQQRLFHKMEGREIVMAFLQGLIGIVCLGFGSRIACFFRPVGFELVSVDTLVGGLIVLYGVCMFYQVFKRALP